jgi:hypothetical protein
MVKDRSRSVSIREPAVIGNAVQLNSTAWARFIDYEERKFWGELAMIRFGDIGADDSPESESGIL